MNGESDDGQDTINRDLERMKGGSDNGQFTINIDFEVKSMNESMQQVPEMLKSSAGRSSCCIFRVPQSLVETNKEAYQPQVVSIGPYHHGKDNLKMVEEHKWRFLKDFLKRMNSTVDKYINIVAPLEEKIRDSYSEEMECDLVKMMVLDGLFLIELFHKVAFERSTFPREDEVDEPLFTMAWVLPSLMRDIIRLENQLPFFVLEKLFEGSEPKSSLRWLILNFFNYVLERPKQVLEKCKLMEGKHILDFYRMGFTANKSSHQIVKIVKKTGKNLARNPFLKVIKSATKLHNSGVIFKPNPSSDTLLDIKFENGQLKIPLITLDDFLTSLFLNCVALEQCYGHCSKDVTAYVTFMGCIINTPADSAFLCDRKIIEKYIGTDKEISRFFNNLGKDVDFNINDNYLSGLFEAVNKYSMDGWHVMWAGFKHTYFGSPWSFMSAFAALMLLVLTFIQTFFAPYGYFNGVRGSPSSGPPR